MSVEYTKNLYKQNLSFANYVQILEESRTKVISLDLINTVISYIIEDKDKKRTLECLEIFYNSIIKSLEWAEVFHKSDFLDIVCNNRIEYESYIVFKKILKFYKTNGYNVVFNRKRFDLCFLKKHFYNYAIYKEYFDSSTFDNMVNINDMNTIQIMIFKNILKDICLRNRDCEELKDYLNSLNLDIDFLKAVVDRNRIVDITCIPNEHIFDFYPYQISNISNTLLSKFYLCSTSSPCKFCGKGGLSYNYDEDIMKRIVQEETEKVKLECINQIENITNQRHRRFMEMRSNDITNNINEADFIDLAYFINHQAIEIDSNLIKTLLRAAKHIKDNDHIIKCFSHIDVSVSEYENIILHYVKNLTENFITQIVLKDIKLFLRIYDSLHVNDKLSYALFVLLYQYFKEVKHTRYQRDYVLNEVYKRKSKLMKITKLILEHHIIKSIDCVVDCFEENFIDLCYFLSEDNCGKFVEQHMHYIYPIIYSKEEFAIFVDNSQFNDKYFHFILINYILSGEIETVKELITQNDNHSEYIIETIVHLLLTGYYDLSVFKTIYINWDTIIETNIIRILFELRKKYYEQFEQISICIFHILRNLLMTLKDRPDIGNRIYPFIESFLSKGCRNCQNMCLELFIQFFTSCFSGILTSNITRLQMMLGFDDIVKNIMSLPMKVGLEHVYCFLTSKGYLKKYLSQKAFVLFKAIFQEEGNKSDETIIKNFMISFMGDLEVNRILSKVYDKIEDEQFIKLLGFISNKFLYKETKRRLKSASIIKDNLKDIANISIEKYVMNVDIEDQDLYCFIIQELSRYSESPNRLPNHLLNSNYTMTYKYDPTNHHREVFKKSYGYEEFLDCLFIHLLFTVKENGNEEYYDFFKYSNLLGTKYLEYSIYQLFHIVSQADNMKTVQLLDNIFRLDGLNYNVVKFLVNLDIYTSNRYFDMKTVLNKSLLIGDYHYCIYLIEKNIRQTDDRNLYNNLQYFYYKIGDYIKTRAINIKFSRVNSTNLFFEFILDRSLEAAKDCLIKVVEEDGSMAPYLTDILNENDDDSFIKQCSMVADDLSEWKNVHSKNRLCLHFLKDCEMIEKSKDLNETLKVITERRVLTGDDLLLIKCHYYLMRAIENSFQNETVGATQQCENTLDTLGGSGIFSSIKQYDECDSIYNFEQELNYSHVRKLIEQEEFDKAIKIISSLLSKRNWGVLYEFSNLYIKQNKLNKSKECLKKVLSLFPKTSNVYQKAFVKYAELVDSKQIYEDALTDIKDSSYLYLLYAKNLEEESPVKSVELYINSILISDEHKYETIPKMLHILSELNDKKNIKTGVKLVNNIVEKEIKIFLPFFSQIITRLNHKNKEMADLVENIVLRLMDNYQNETHWKAILLMNSSDSEVKERTKNIIQRLSLDKKIYLSNTKKFSEVLSSLASCNDKEICIEKSFPDIYTVINNGNITVPNTSIKIEGVDKKVEVFTSLQAPKKISFIGSDGRIYRWLCKYRDDLRKDSRFMELNCLINSLFSKNKLNYYIRTYEVIPFSHNYGIIEFIDGLASLKSICNELYQRENISISNITKKYAKTKKIKAQNYKEVINMFPPRFYKWFEENFSIPYNWFVARDNYTKTCAVMNIMGWFMGLGDRHADNILFDINVGDTVHVDLNSIFESSKKLSIPERVPFRLTQNIVDAFGVLGLEGTYSNTMNETLDLFLKNRNLIISNLLSFVYDPLHEWRIRKEKAPKMVLEVLEKKLSPTDVTLKVENLNEEAMSTTNLCEMYIGWLPFI